VDLLADPRKDGGDRHERVQRTRDQPLVRSHSDTLPGLPSAQRSSTSLRNVAASGRESPTATRREKSRKARAPTPAGITRNRR
jgi:hypothetical protein